MTLTLKARVHAGRLLLDEPIDLPEGSEVDLLPVMNDDDLDDQGRAALHAAIERADAQFRAGQGIPASEALARLRRVGT